MDTLGSVLVLIALVVVAAAVVSLRARRRRSSGAPAPSRDDLAAIAENQRVNGHREHGQGVSPQRWADRGGWGG